MLESFRFLTGAALIAEVLRFLIPTFVGTALIGFLDSIKFLGFTVVA